MARKTYNEKLHSAKDLPKIEDISDQPEAVRRYGGTRMLIAAPTQYNEIMARVPEGRVTTTDRVRAQLAAQAGADFTCPLTAGIFVNVCAHASEEREGEKIPWWRTLKAKGELNEKYPGGMEAQRLLLEMEGHEVIQRGKRCFVRGFEDRLAGGEILTDEERAALYPIILSEYNPAWPQWFAEEKVALERLIGEDIVRISHVGSTAVPGLMAKPTVDILLEIAENTDVEALMAVMPPAYICLYPPTMPTPPPHLCIIKGYLATGFAERVYHIHVRYPGDWPEPRFRDYLIAHPETAAAYAALKRELRERYEHDRDGYTAAKGAFIGTVMKTKD